MACPARLELLALLFGQVGRHLDDACWRAAGAEERTRVVLKRQAEREGDAELMDRVDAAQLAWHRDERDVQDCLLPIDRCRLILPLMNLIFDLAAFAIDLHAARVNGAHFKHLTALVAWRIDEGVAIGVERHHDLADELVDRVGRLVRDRREHPRRLRARWTVRSSDAVVAAIGVKREGRDDIGEQPDAGVCRRKSKRRLLVNLAVAEEGHLVKGERREVLQRQ